MSKAPETRSVEWARAELISLVDGTLTDSERAAIERSFFEDDEHFEALLAAEDELIDDLADGSLPEPLVAQLDENPDRIPGLEGRIRTVHLLRAAARRVACETDAKLRTPVPPFRPAAPPPGRQPPSPRWLLLAAAALGALAATWLLVPMASGPFGADEPIVLTTSTTRDGSVPTTLPASGALKVVLEIDESIARHGRFQARLATLGRPVWNLGQELEPRHFDWGLGLVLGINTEALRPGIYVVELYPEGQVASEDQHAEGRPPVASYRFRIPET